MYNLLPCIQFEFFKYFNFLTDYRVHILVVSFYAMANIHHRAGLRSVFCLYGTCFHFFGDTLFIRQMHAGNNAADKCGRQIQQIWRPGVIWPQLELRADNGAEQFRLLSLLLNLPPTGS